MMMKRKMTFVVTGGGTGGHIYPALAIARGLEKRFSGAEVHYIGSHRGLEKSIVPREGLPFLAVHSRGLERKVHPKAMLSFGVTALGLLEALVVLRRLKPQALIGTGGFVALPVAMAALFLGIPTLIHEQNAFAGITNRILAPRVRKVLLTFDEARKRLESRQAVLTGLPVRPSIVTATRAEGRQFFSISEDSFVLLVVGGSRGAQRLNEALPTLAKAWSGNNKYHIIHVTGQANYDSTREHYQKTGIDLDNDGNIKIIGYLDHMELALAAADLAVGRSGAAFLSELTVRGVPSLLVPYPYAAENHQEANARSMEAAGAAQILLDKDVDGETIKKTIQSLCNQPTQLASMAKAAKALGQPEALERILDEIEDVL
ncbi:undecaprenyldiphospho-muramoylpentapeptide beta-N-acetylglucosaminyltransferase [Heliorestis convoluta]|uniref:UDP-N-acetylglucosamine--N-acetylmuramyl-(pentapeptide) pyrophosphoryl-undecaprenol N-acetylglucosamine transferase n=1 Tax=Heliorestis convoluta TaxID=356322 RepID=A0A5Q2N1Y5_9FIRM|nr:undecaprenyldiphospho-muramoylpentapeptide beta-N-acetylglucosaminyltransferase [Heliorestis convoluta]QGG47853.1 undecaprenyldiphospho-muramoylpentapeptide beta-N-acetylglucosaminyltransferase [Heliorestis convoluta]